MAQEYLELRRLRMEAEKAEIELKKRTDQRDDRASCSQQSSRLTSTTRFLRQLRLNYLHSGSFVTGGKLHARLQTNRKRLPLHPETIVAHACRRMDYELLARLEQLRDRNTMPDIELEKFRRELQNVGGRRSKRGVPLIGRLGRSLLRFG